MNIVAAPARGFFARVLVWLHAILPVAKKMFTPLALGFLCYVAWHSRSDLELVLRSADWGPLALAMIILAFAHFVTAGATLVILKILGISISYRNVLRPMILRLPARYLPGGVWHTVGRMADFFAQGVGPSDLTLLVILENLLAIGLASVLGGGVVWYFRGSQDFWGGVALSMVVVSVLVLLVTPLLLIWKRKIRLRQFHISFYLLACVVYALIWLIFAVGFVVFISAFPVVAEGVSALELGGVYLFSWAIGLMAIFAPQGIGVFEVISGSLLSSPSKLGGVATVVAGFRLVSLVADIGLWVAFKLLLELAKMRSLQCARLRK